MHSDYIDPADWQPALSALLAAREPAERSLRVAVLGIGNELAGDDAAGIAVVDALADRLAAQPDERTQVLVLDGGAAPENQAGPLRRFEPDVVLMIDAAQMGLPAGTVQWLDWREIEGISASSHIRPLNILAEYLGAEIGCEVALLGIQPAGDEVYTPLSAEARAAVDEIVQGLVEVL